MQRRVLQQRQRREQLCAVRGGHVRRDDGRGGVRVVPRRHSFRGHGRLECGHVRELQQRGLQRGRRVVVHELQRRNLRHGDRLRGLHFLRGRVKKTTTTLAFPCTHAALFSK